MTHQNTAVNASNPDSLGYRNSRGSNDLCLHADEAKCDPRSYLVQKKRTKHFVLTTLAHLRFLKKHPPDDLLLAEAYLHGEKCLQRYEEENYLDADNEWEMAYMYFDQNCYRMDENNVNYCSDDIDIFEDEDLYTELGRFAAGLSTIGFCSGWMLSDEVWLGDLWAKARGLASELTNLNQSHSAMQCKIHVNLLFDLQNGQISELEYGVYAAIRARIGDTSLNLPFADVSIRWIQTMLHGYGTRFHDVGKDLYGIREDLENEGKLVSTRKIKKAIDNLVKRKLIVRAVRKTVAYYATGEITQKELLRMAAYHSEVKKIKREKEREAEAKKERVEAQNITDEAIQQARKDHGA